VTGDPFQQGSGPSPWQAPSTTPEGGEPLGVGGGIPWENEQSFQAMLDTIKGVLLEPSKTFAMAKPDASVGPAIMYALILGFIGGALSTAWGYATSAVLGNSALPLPEEMKWLSGFTEPGLTQLIATPFGVLIGLFVGGGIIHVILMIAGGANAGFEATVRCVAFASGSVALMQIVPMLGASIAGIWTVVIEILALKELHRTTHGKTAIAVLGPILICCCLVAVAMAIGGAALATSFNK
jgi:hypothetical protein